MKKIILVLTLLLLAFVPGDTKLAYEGECSPELNIWYRPSPTKGETFTLDMSKGYSFVDHIGIHILVKNVETNTVIDMVFPIDSYWYSDGSVWNNDMYKENKGSGKIERDYK